MTVSPMRTRSLRSARQGQAIYFIVADPEVKSLAIESRGLKRAIQDQKDFVSGNVYRSIRS
jgi:hypothetical protein